MHVLSNGIISIAVSAKGAELQSLQHLQTGWEYLWQAGAEWPKKSPVLFPIVGELKNHQYTYRGNPYQLGRHGFARDKNFELTAQTEHSITFWLQSNRDTLQVYPFEFAFSVRYTLKGNSLEVSFVTMNNGDQNMPFSVGAHPAFRVPLVPGTTYNDYYLSFEKEEKLQRWPISAQGLIEKEPVTIQEKGKDLPLSKDLFAQDALVFKHLHSRSVSLVSHKSSNGLKVTFEGFPYLGIWAGNGGDFVCIEPWCGIADAVDASGAIEEKEGINIILPGEVFIRSYHIELF